MPETNLEAALLRLLDLLVFAAHTSATGRRFQTATGVSLPRSSVDTLAVLERGPRSGGELALILRVDPTQSSRQVRRLIHDGLIEKQRLANDGRKVTLSLSPAGHRLIRRWQTSWQVEMRRPVEGWDDDDLRAFTIWLLCVRDRLMPLLLEVNLLAPETAPSPEPPATERPSLARCLAAITDLVFLVGRTDFGGSLRASGVDIPTNQYLALRDVAAFGPTTITELAARLELEQSVASRTVTALHDSGLLHTHAGRTDRRTRRLLLTAAGERVLAEAQDSRLSGLAELFTDLDDTAAELYGQLTARYVDDLLITADAAAGRYA